MAADRDALYTGQRSGPVRRQSSNCRELAQGLFTEPSWMHCVSKFFTTYSSDRGWQSWRQSETFLTEGTEGIQINATLSHCWGQAKGLSTTKSTLDQHVQGIMFQDLPKSFQDAVTVSRSLGLPYLWIDSLCIIQDSKSDWERESQCMQDVYAHAILNISADAAKDSTVGIQFTEQAVGEDMAVDEPGDVYAARGGTSALDTHGLSHIPRDSPAEEHVLRRRA
ncbi:hypothetical protein IFR05_016431, partial [Cadophora sp. M221]